MSSGRIVLGVVVGAVAGAVLGMLFAPGSGSATRKRLLRKGTEYVEEGKEKLNEYSDAATEEYDALKEGTRAWVEKEKQKTGSVVGAKHAT